MADKKFDLRGIYNKYKEEKSDGFKTRSTKDLKKEREGIKKGYYLKGVALFFITLVLLAAYKFITGDYEDVRGKAAKIEPITDKIEIGKGEPSLDIMKDQIESLKESQLKINDDYNEKLTKTTVAYEKKIEQLSEELKQQNKNHNEINETIDENNTEEVANLRNELFSEITDLKNQISGYTHKQETLPELDLNSSTIVASKKIKEEVISVPYTIEQLDENLLSDDENRSAPEVIAFSIVTGLSKGLLVTGVQAPTSGDGIKNPKPVLVTFNSDLLLPNDERINIKECTGLGSAVGDMNSRRAEITITKLNCIVERDGNKYKVEEKVKAYIIGEDGSFGLRGRLVDSGSKLVIRELQVGFLQGVNQAFQTAVQPSLSSSYSPYGSGYPPTPYPGGGYPGGASVPYPTAQQAGLSGVAYGGNTGLNALAEYYQKMMEGLYPTISIRAGREVGVLWHGGESIELKATRIFSVDGESDSQELDQPFETEESEVLRKDEW